MACSLPTVLLFGQTNVGKSTLFNRLTQSRKAVVHNTPGVTRDILTTIVDQKFQLLDSGGLGSMNDPFSGLVEGQVEQMLKTVDVIVWVLSGKQALNARDFQISKSLRKLNKPTLLVVNKIDAEKDEINLFSYYSLGWDIVLPVSAEHGLNISTLREAILSALPSKEDAHLPQAPKVQFAIIGRPNVGKSSITNALLKENRVLVSDIAGTTRDAVTCPFSWQFKNGACEEFLLVDTAGIRKNITDPLEYYAYVRTEKTLNTVDLAVIVLDLFEGPTNIDKNLINYVQELGKGYILVVNKWDIARQTIKEHHEDPVAFQQNFLQRLQQLCPFCHAPILFVSAKTGEGLDKLLTKILKLQKNLCSTLPTGPLNRLLQKITTQTQPASHHGKHFKIYYALQVKSNPLTLQVFCNKLKWMPNTYQKFLENKLRDTYELAGCPIVWKWVEKTASAANTLPSLSE